MAVKKHVITALLCRPTGIHYLLVKLEFLFLIVYYVDNLEEEENQQCYILGTKPLKSKFHVIQSL